MKQYNIRPAKKKTHAWLIVLVCIVVFIFAAVSAVGIIAGSDSEKRQTVSSAVEENEQLKSELEKKNGEIDELNKKIDDLEAELKTRPTPVPTPFKIENKTENSGNDEKVSPRVRSEQNGEG